jgi:hypothetical protein
MRLQSLPLQRVLADATSNSGSHHVRRPSVSASGGAAPTVVTLVLQVS